MITLVVDASTTDGTVALFDGTGLRSTREVAMRGRDAERLLPAVADALASASLTARDVGRVVCGAGPGSFTSLRIAASIAKGICAAVSVPLHAVSSLGLVVAANAPESAGEYLAVFDALRGQSFVQRIRVADGAVEVVAPFEVISDFEDADHDVEVVGPGHGANWKPHARGALRLLPRGLPPVDLAAWEPDYGRKAEAQARWEAAHGAPLT